MSLSALQLLQRDMTSVPSDIEFQEMGFSTALDYISIIAIMFSRSWATVALLLFTSRARKRSAQVEEPRANASAS